ncbi:Transcription factor grauzone [Lucilia cuprina]|nr:Transcription factor grauzone [Lucilia cuprina]
MDSWLCLTCWKELDQFHKFYLRIEEAHIQFGKINLGKEFKEENDMKNFAACCLEPEILIEPNILEDEETSCLKTNNKADIGVNQLNNDPLEKTIVIKTKKKRNFINKTKTDIKSEPDHSSDSASEREEDNPNSHESSKEAKQKIKRLNRKEKDKFIVENFDQMFCDVCGVPFENFSSMLKHFSREHKRKGYLLCCNRKFYERNNLVDHLQCHLNPDYFKCPQCGKVLSDRKNFKSHLLRVHRPKDVVLKHSCEICGKSFTQGYVLRTHKLTHLPKEEKKFPCTECGKFFRRPETLKEHIASQHTGATLYTCPWCPKTFNSNGNMHAHRKNVHPKECLELRLQRYSRNIPPEIS